MPLLDVPAEVSAAAPSVAATPNGAPNEGMPDFSLPARRVRFRIDGDVFEGPRDLPAIHALRFIGKARAWQGADTEVAAALLPELLSDVLLPESLARFQARLADQDNPIGLPTLPEVVAYLFSEYGMRPTQPSSDSSNGDGPPDDGTSSTDAPPSAGSTLAGSPSPGS